MTNPWFVTPPEDQCPTHCEPWCAAKCHESHVPTRQRSHEPGECRAWQEHDRRELEPDEEAQP